MKTELFIGNDTALPMLPGPVSVPDDILEAMAHDYDSGHTKDEHILLYNSTAEKLAQILGTTNDVLLMSGEAMVILWGAIKSCLQARDKVLCIATGVFGAGFAPMAQSIGCEVKTIELPYSSTINTAQALEQIEAAIKSFAPKMITVVHCETPSGTLNPLEALGELKKKYNVPLLCVDAVASVGGVPVLADACNLDIVMGGAQKCLSAPPSMGFASVSSRAWDEIKKVSYAGYDAFLPFYKPQSGASLPYTPYKHGTAALHRAAERILQEGLTACFSRHQRVAEECRQGLKELGIPLFTDADAVNSPTVTAALVPQGRDWAEFRNSLITRGLVVAGSFGPMAGKVFRLGHMGTQANSELVANALKVLASVL